MAKWNFRSDGQRTRHARARSAINDRRALIHCLVRHELALEKLLADVRETLEKADDVIVSEERDWLRGTKKSE